MNDPRSSEPGTLDLKLSDYLQLVLAHNEAVQAQMLETEATRRKGQGEDGIFEPNLALSALRERNKRINNNEQQSASGGLPLFSEVNDIYDTGLEQLIPTGGKIRLGYTLSDLSNNLTNQFSFANLGGLTNLSQQRQYHTFIGVTFTQPLLKNAGTEVTLAGIRLAAMDSEIAFQQYRRQLMLALSQAEAAYWNLYFAQEQLRFFDESVALASSVLADSQERLKAGRAAELDVLESQSGLALRKTKENESRQNFFVAVSRVLSL